MALPEVIDDLKRSISGPPRYRLRNANVYVSAGGYHFIDYLDPTSELPPTVEINELRADDISYIERSLQSNPERFENQVAAVKRYVPLNRCKALDVGCGGGIFLAMLREEGADVTGVELNDVRILYAQQKHQLSVVKRPIESPYWQEQYAGHFDVVSLWDVIEHVNFPYQTLQAAARLLKPGGFLFIDTPCRDSFYHRAGELTYRASGGRYPTFLNAMYSSAPFGHKQIFSVNELSSMVEATNLKVVEQTKFHELSFPHSFYLRKLMKSELLVRMSLPLVRAMLYVMPVRNKMLIVGQKQA